MQNKMSTQHSVDSHFHVFKARLAVPEARYSPSYAAPLSNWQSAAQAVGVTHGVLVQTSFMGTDNTHLLKHLQKNPNTLRGVAVVAPTECFWQMADLNRQGVRGIRINLAGQSHDMAAWQIAKPLWDAVQQLGWHVELHTDTGALPAVLAAVPLEVPVVIDHFCRPASASLQDDTVRAVQGRVAAASAQVYIKLSAAYRLQTDIKPNELASLWLGELGDNALLWGSDWPCTNFEVKADYPALHGALEDWLESDSAAIQAARSVNPMKLYWAECQPFQAIPST
jgi:predicted TIM-barrel fold metal-dependent hydrolase